MTQGEMWGWAQRFAAEGWTATQAADYLRGFFRFSNQPWYATFKEAFAQVGYKEDIKKLAPTYIVPETMAATREHVDWKTRYNYIAEVRYFNPETTRWETKHVQAQSDVLLTKRDWRMKIEEVFGGLPGSPSYDPERGLEFVKEEFWIRGRP